MIIETCISYGHKELLDIFFKANNLDARCELRKSHPVNKINVYYEDDSETAISITFMSMIHLGIENMFCDYLNRCGINPEHVKIGQSRQKLSDEELEAAWQEHRKTIGLR